MDEMINELLATSLLVGGWLCGDDKHAHDWREVCHSPRSMKSKSRTDRSWQAGSLSCETPFSKPNDRFQMHGKEIYCVTPLHYPCLHHKEYT